MLNLKVAFKKAIASIAYKKAIADIAFKKAIADIAFKKAIAKIAFKKAIAKIEFGNFILWRFFYDSAAVNDQATKASTKSLSDSSSVSDAQFKGLTKPFTDNASIGDTPSIEPGKVLSDSSAFTDDQTLGIGKRPDDPVALTEAQAKAFSKTINETFYATDDLDGQASADDEQNITFVKVRTEILAITDVISILLNQGRIIADSSVVSDSGSLRSQGYVSFDYFQDDYVGASRTF